MVILFMCGLNLHICCCFAGCCFCLGCLLIAVEVVLDLFIRGLLGVLVLRGCWLLQLCGLLFVVVLC